MVGVSHLAGFTSRQTRDGLRKLGIPEAIIDQFPPTTEGMDRLLAFVGRLRNWDGKHRRVPYQELGAADMIERALAETPRWAQDNAAKQQKQSPKTLRSIVGAAKNERWPERTDVRRKQVDPFIAGFPNRLSRIDINTATRSE